MMSSLEYSSYTVFSQHIDLKVKIETKVTFIQYLYDDVHVCMHYRYIIIHILYRHYNVDKSAFTYITRQMLKHCGGEPE